MKNYAPTYLLLALASCAATFHGDEPPTSLRLGYAQTSADDSLGALDELSLDTGHGALVALTTPLNSSGLYGVTSIDFVDASGKEGVDVMRFSIAAGLEQRLQITDGAHLYVQAGGMQSDYTVEQPGANTSADEFGFFAAIGVEAMLSKSASAFVQWRPIEPEVDLVPGLGVDSHTIAIGVGVSF